MPHIKGHLTIKFDLPSSFISLTSHLFSTTFVFILNNLVYNWNWLEGTHTINSRCQRFIWIRILSSIKTVRSAVYLEILLILAYTCNANMLAQYAVHLPNRQWIVRPIHFYINYLILFFYLFFYIYNFVLYFFLFISDRSRLDRFLCNNGWMSGKFIYSTVCSLKYLRKNCLNYRLALRKSRISWYYG